MPSQTTAPQTPTSNSVVYAKDLPEDTHRRLRLAALWSGRTMKEFLTVAIEDAIVKYEVPEAIFKAPPTFAPAPTPTSNAGEIPLCE